VELVTLAARPRRSIITERRPAREPATPPPVDLTWRILAECADADDPQEFDARGKFPTDTNIRAAHDFCGSCPVRVDCRLEADRMRGTEFRRWGVWGARYYFLTSRNEEVDVDLLALVRPDEERP